ncbi:hypothetical protein F5J12DRAFT_886741 [Pisolithus orientalis]|uniref:uncharacterized protein n=1 Tax=Pisolithus orientalis TaxID=936130 RepID=UPI002225AB00|nr:uncharacterized protein F5J12DRAFT_886741 [Pisolithus orientalis]KAI6034910.1 hypothetical protein F5J12DRAFT_886741 [Pisolithus orientalis]
MRQETPGPGSAELDDEEPILPVYEAVSTPSPISPAGSNPWVFSFDSDSPPSFLIDSSNKWVLDINPHGNRRSRGQPSHTPSNSISNQSFLHMEPLTDALTYIYSLSAGDAPIQITIMVEAEADRQNFYTFSIALKAGHVERAICKPITLRLSVNPRQLDFSVFVFPPRSSLPVGCLHHLRVWLRSAAIDHRIFGDNDLWVGRDPDFRSIADASFAILRNATQDMLIYQAIVGRAHRTPHAPLSPSSSVSSQVTESYIYQRLWKTDDFKIGAYLDFDALGSKLIMAVRDPNSPQSERDQPHRNRSIRRLSRLPMPNSDASGDPVHDR